MTYNGPDQRLHRRVEVVLSITVARLDGTDDSRVEDISVGGVRFVTRNEYDVGQKVGIQIEDLEESDVITGRVVRVEGPNRKGLYSVAVKFGPVPPRTFAKLDALVRKGFIAPTVILIAVEDREFSDLILSFLPVDRYDLRTTPGLSELKKSVEEVNPDLVVAEVSGSMKELKTLRENAGDRPVVIISDKLDADLKSKAHSFGIYECIRKTFKPKGMREALWQAIRSHRSEMATRGIKAYENWRPAELVTRCAKMVGVRNEAIRIAPTDVVVLFTGETGTGKEEWAKFIHNNSHRQDGPFVTMDLSTLEEGLASREMFGQKKGAYTHAISDIEGFVEKAARRKGTLFIDEIDKATPAMQKKLLRFTEKLSYHRMGEKEKTATKADVRLIIATSENLEVLVEKGKFSRELYYRISGCEINIPPLRERSEEDLLQLAGDLVIESNGICKTTVTKLGDESIKQIVSHHWPGNTRELRRAIERSLPGTKGKTLHSLKMPKKKTASEKKGTATISKSFKKLSWKKLNEKLDKDNKPQKKAYIEAVLEENDGSINKTADHMGISRQALRKLVTQFGIIPSKHKKKKK